MRYAVKSSAVIHELLNEEMIIANLDSGFYYSLRGSGMILWQLLINHASIHEMASSFFERYHVETEGEIRELINELLQEDLIIEAHSNHQYASTCLFWPQVYTRPYLEKYEEMKNLLMLDPIHEVDEQGWPAEATPLQ